MGLRPWAAAAIASAFMGAVAASGAEPMRFVLPVACDLGRTCVVQNYVDDDPTDAARDYRCGTLTYNGHDGTDFRLRDTPMQRAGVDVLAAADGLVERRRDGMADDVVPLSGKFTQKGSECGNGVIISHAGGWQTQYCHLAKGSVRVNRGDRVAAGQPIGRVGLSGNTQFPHLHFTTRQNGQTVDPFAYQPQAGVCGSGSALWQDMGPSFDYQPRRLLNSGFASGPVTMEGIEIGEIGAGVATTSPALVAFVRAIGLQKGDEQRLRIVGPDGTTIVDHAAPALDRAKAQSMLFAGKPRPSIGWAAGTYVAHYTVTNDGKSVLEQSFKLAL